MATVQRKRFTTPVDQKQVASDWARRGFDCNPFTDPPGQQWTDFAHDQDELITVVQGRLEVEVEQDSRVLEAGDEVHIPAGALHSVRNIHAGECRWLYGFGTPTQASPPL